MTYLQNQALTGRKIVSTSHRPRSTTRRVDFHQPKQMLQHMLRGPRPEQLTPNGS